MDTPDSPGSVESISPIPSPVNKQKDPDFILPDAEGKAPVPPVETLTTPTMSSPPGAYDKKIVCSSFKKKEEREQCSN